MIEVSAVDAQERGEGKKQRWVDCQEAGWTCAGGWGRTRRVCAEEQVDAWVTSSNTTLSNPCKDFSGGSDGKTSAYNVGNPGSVPGLGRSPGEGNGNPLQYSCLENPMDGGAWSATVHRVAKSRTRLSDVTFTFTKSVHLMTSKSCLNNLINTKF